MTERRAAVDARAELDRGRESVAAGRWMEAFERLSAADGEEALGGEDLELLARAAYLVGRDAEHLAALERAHIALRDSGEPLRAARCAFWLGIHLASAGSAAPAGGWFARAERLVARVGRPCAEQGYLRLPVALRAEAAGDYETARTVAVEAAEIGERFGDADLLALALQEQGRAQLRLGRIGPGLKLLDEAMVGVAAGETSPIVTGLVYCSVIDGCQEAHELSRAREWTTALARWCDGQPDLVPFTGQCLVHRAEIMQLRGEWADALTEARDAGRRLAGRIAVNRAAAAQASYREGEVLRLRGEVGAAEGAYREASRRSWEPQPGLALLRLAEGKSEAAAAMVGRALSETTWPLERARLLPAHVDALLAAGDAEGARRAGEELEAIAVGHDSRVLEATAAYARGAVLLDDGDPAAALIALRSACAAWQSLEVPYEAARARQAIGLACRGLGDEETAAMELSAAREVFAELGAEPDRARAEALLAGARDGAGEAGLTPRELEVLRLVAAGRSNRQIAAALTISEHTVARHLQNTFAKLGVSSRTAAAAYAFEHDLA